MRIGNLIGLMLAKPHPSPHISTNDSPLTTGIAANAASMHI
ncbi:hypothetical protein [Thalassospira mesophila]|nr:hypothetical protein [Thalassospira mesophila]